MSSTVLTFEIAADPPPRLDKAIARDVPDEAALSRTRLARLIADGAVRIEGVVADNPKARVVAGAMVEIVLEEAEESHIGPEAIPLDIRYEDDDIVVVNKP
ncbi:MAG: RNA pseudouridine synthase, partial [Pseudomonadota bacterium]